MPSTVHTVPNNSMGMLHIAYQNTYFDSAFICIANCVNIPGYVHTHFQHQHGSTAHCISGLCFQRYCQHVWTLQVMFTLIPASPGTCTRLNVHIVNMCEHSSVCSTAWECCIYHRPRTLMWLCLNRYLQGHPRSCSHSFPRAAWEQCHIPRQEHRVLGYCCQHGWCSHSNDSMEILLTEYQEYVLDSVCILCGMMLCRARCSILRCKDISWRRIS